MLWLGSGLGSGSAGDDKEVADVVDEVDADAATAEEDGGDVECDEEATI